MFRRERTSGKRKFPTPVTKAVSAPTKHTNLQLYVLPAPTDRTPHGSQELRLLMAGLGKRHISLPDNSNHADVSFENIKFASRNNVSNIIALELYGSICILNS